jgi:hypothetical protein
MTETDKIALLQEGCVFLAKTWKRTAAPISYEQSVYVDGEWVKVTIQYDETRGHRKPARRAGDDMETMNSERSIDA